MAGGATAGTLLIPIGMAVFGYLMLRKFVLDLMDEVWDAGATLLIRNGGEEDCVTLADIINISYTTLQNPNRVTLTLRQPCRLGAKFHSLP